MLDVTTVDEIQDTLTALIKGVLGKKLSESSGKRRVENETVNTPKAARSE